jgi:nitrogen fixation/metabolism regulation signal transduction histidine kinase
MQAAAAKARQDRRDGPQGRLLRGYLHKTSNTLCGIKGYASLIAEDTERAAEAARWARRIIAEVERLEDIFRSVGDLTDPVAAVETGADLGLIVTAAAAAVRTAHPAVTWRTETMPRADLLLPAADLGLVMRELLANAAEGRGGGGGARNVGVCTTIGPNGRIALHVADDGPGMEPALAAQAADPFVTTKDGRAGVGLTRVETLLDMYGLAWRLHTEAGLGTMITLEVATSTAAAASA